MSGKSSLLFLNKEKLKDASHELSYDDIVDRISEGNFKLSDNTYPDFKIDICSKGDLNIWGSDSVKYAVFSFSIESMSSRVRIQHQLIVFENENIGFIVDYNNARALSLIRALLNVSEKNIIECYKIDSRINYEELFYWIIRKIYENDNELEMTRFNAKNEKRNVKVTLSSVDGLKGRVISSLNKVSTQGSEVTNTLTALAFILESKTVTDLTVTLSFNQHKHVVSEIHIVNNDITIGVNENEYSGIFDDDDLLRAKLLLLIYLDLIPSLLDLYVDDTENTSDQNSLTEKEKLIQKTIDDITQKIDGLKKMD